MFTLLATAGCVGAPPSSTTKPSALESPSGIVAEYRATVSSFPLPLPKGFAFPAQPPKALLNGVGEQGVGIGPVYFYWLCAWESSYLTSDEKQDQAGRQKALNELDKWTSTSFVKEYVQDPGNQWYAAVVQKAKLGDPSGVREDMSGGCSDYGITTP